MATSRVPNRYVKRADLIRLLDSLFQKAYTVTEHSDAWVVSDTSRELTEEEIESISKREPVQASKTSATKPFGVLLVHMDNMSTADSFRRSVNDIRIENSDGRKFVPEKEFFSLLSKNIVTDIVRRDSALYHVQEIVNFVIESARKVFGILVLIRASNRLKDFIKNDQYGNRTTDGSLPLAKDTLNAILEDHYIAADFFEKQWEFCVPVFSGRLMHRQLERHTILPYLEESPMQSGGFGIVSRIRIHPSHQSESFGTSATFVRKEFEFDNSTYETEVRVLSTLQLLKNPNILQLAGCYTYRSKHNLITPYMTGGTLRSFLKSPRPGNFTRERLIHSLSGLACGLWALHELVLENNVLSHKGHHQDLELDNILIEGDRFILADFGLSSIRNITETSQTPFKGRRGYCQAPECAELGPPYREYSSTRATDVFNLGCIAADAVVHLVRGLSGIEEFRNAREFKMAPMCYYLYHKEDAANEAVINWLRDVAHEDGHQSIKDVVKLITDMLQISPQARPSASSVMARLCVSTIQAYSEHFADRFAMFVSSPDVIIEQARFGSWQLTQDSSLYSDTHGATETGKNFDSTIQVLRQMKECLEAIQPEELSTRTQPFLEISILNTQLLNTLSPSRRTTASSWFESIMLSKVPSDPKESTNAPEDIGPVLGDSRVRCLAQIKHMVAKVDDKTFAPPSFERYVIHDPITVTGAVDRYKVGVVFDKKFGLDQTRLIETIYYQDLYSRQMLEKRLDGLCHLLSDPQVAPQLGALPFAGIIEHPDQLSFNLLYEFPNQYPGDLYTGRPISLHELLKQPDHLDRPPWESRMQLSVDLTEALAAFHDVNWYHKDLTPFNVLFFPDQAATAATRIRRPYLMGFQHSHNASDDMTEGPVQDRKHQRYHHPQYIDVQNHQFKRFEPRYDWYSLGILLVEIGFWSPIDKTMKPLTMSRDDNSTFSTKLLQQKVPELAFMMGSNYARVVRRCLTNLHDDGTVEGQPPSPHHSTTNLFFKERVVTPLKDFCSPRSPEVGRKRKREDDA